MTGDVDGSVALRDPNSAPAVPFYGGSSPIPTASVQRDKTPAAMETRILTPTVEREPSMVLAPSYPGNDEMVSASWGGQIGLATPDLPLQTDGVWHRIVDGDTLPELADRYLGSPDRAEEIFAANRAILADPSLLPIGARLHIPGTTRP